MTTAYAYYPMYERLNMMRADTGLKMCLSVCAYHIPSKNRISCILSPQPFYARRLIANKIYILSYMSTALRSPSRSTRVHARTAYTNTHTHTHSLSGTTTLTHSQPHTQKRNRKARWLPLHLATMRACVDYRRAAATMYTQVAHIL